MAEREDVRRSHVVRSPVSKPVLGVGIIGFGAIGRVHSLAIASCEDARVVAVSRESAEPTTADGLTWYRDYRQLLRQSDIDVVAICSPNGLHAEHARAALISGKHVVVEKPLTLDIGEAMELVALAKDRHLMLASIVQLRFEEQNIRIKQLITDGALGRPVLGEVLVPWHRGQAYYDAAAWRGTLDADGGVLLTQALHTVDLLCWFFGPTSESFGLTATLTHEIEAEDTAVSMIRFASGALGVVAATTSAFPGAPERLSLFFDAGHCTVSGHEIVEWTFSDIVMPSSSGGRAGSGVSDPAEIGVAGHRAQWEDILHSLRQGTETAVTGIDALDTLGAILQARGTCLHDK